LQNSFLRKELAMNMFIGSGKVSRVNLIDGERRILKFTLAITENSSKEGKKRTDHVPCMIYNPVDEVLEMLNPDQEVELQGRVKTFSFEFSGETTYKTEVVVNHRSLKVLG
jgi:hypothetical protein